MEPVSGVISGSKAAFLSASIVAQFLAGSIPLEGITMHMCPSNYPRNQIVALIPIQIFRKPLQIIINTQFSLMYPSSVHSNLTNICWDCLRVSLLTTMKYTFSQKRHLRRHPKLPYKRGHSLNAYPNILERSQRAVWPLSMGIMGVKRGVSSISIVAQFFAYTIYLKSIAIHLSDLASSHFKSVRSSIFKRLVVL